LDERTSPEEQTPPEARQPPAPETYRGDVLPPSPPPPPIPSYTSHRGRHTGGWLVGVIVIIIGIGFLGQNLGWWSGWALHNWWALFILIPAFGSLGRAWRQYIANGRRFGGEVARPLLIGLLLVFVTIVFLLELDWAYVWPVVLILVGVGLLLGRWRRS
jgi:hypothetical protein